MIHANIPNQKHFKMLSYNENISKHLKLIENGIQKTHRQAYGEHLKNEYVEFLSEQIKLENEEESKMKAIEKRILDETEGPEYQELAAKTKKFQSEEETLKKELHELSENFDNLTIRSAVQKESKKKEEEDSIMELKAFYLSEYEQLNATWKHTNRECEKIERERQQHIERETTTRKSSLTEIKTHLQNQIFERNSELFRAEQKNKEMRKQLEDLKRNIEQLEHQNRQQCAQIVHFQNSRPSSSVIYGQANNILPNVEINDNPEENVKFKEEYNTRFEDTKQENVSIICEGPGFDLEDVEIIEEDFIKIDEDQIELLTDKDFDFAETQISQNTSGMKPNPFGLNNGVQ